MDEEIKMPEQVSEEKNKEAENEESKLSLFAHFKKWKAKNKKTDFYMELALFFILGILIGIALKTEAVKKITIGFDDYKMKIQEQDYDLNKLEKDSIEKQKEAAAAQEKAQADANNAQGNPDQNAPAE